MRRELEPASPVETLRDVLLRIAPAGLASFLKEGPGFRAHFVGAGTGAPATELSSTLRLRPEGKQEAGLGRRYQLAPSGVFAEVALEVARELGVAVQSVTLTNEGSEPAPPIRERQPVPSPLGYGGPLSLGLELR